MLLQLVGLLARTLPTPRPTATLALLKGNRRPWLALTYPLLPGTQPHYLTRPNSTSLTYHSRRRWQLGEHARALSCPPPGVPVAPLPYEIRVILNIRLNP
ncbi:hypothetical protein [Hymenobacter sublimis]|uniref:Secreted protein n=1 Tax=Hymenobacter sublimis TaxID=2933777 RepID=A0ABY4J8P2_9BACT|nr:hypothetical protein [Hymenobacter sublimis]UPL47774.1 hypothetical protein MWH26_11270 [Hymenobacter sublimis]